MKLKKLMPIFLFNTIMVLSAFSQADEYTKHLEKAKAYEATKQWIYALGEYYDANICYAYLPDLEESEAKKSFDKLLRRISSGQPGYGEFDAFDLYDNWILMLKEFEQYWTEYCPILISISKLNRESLDPNTKTAIYTFKCSPYYTSSSSLGVTEKYRLISNAVTNGFQKKYKEQKWNTPFSEWPEKSVYHNNDNKKNLFTNKTALFRIYIDEHYEPLTEKTVLASSALITYFSSIYSQLDRTRYKMEVGETTLYDIALNIVDDTGKIIKKFDRQLVNSSNYYKFTVSSDEMKSIESGKIKIVPSELYLFYGDSKSEIFIPEDGSGKRDFIKNLSEIKIDLSKINFIDYNNLNDTDRINQARKLEDEKKILKNEINIINKSLNEFSFSEDDVKEVKIDKVAKFAFIRPHSQIPTGSTPLIMKKFDKETIEKTYIYCLCNLINLKSNLPPYYSINSSESYKNEFESFLLNFNNIKKIHYLMYGILLQKKI